MPRDTRLTLWPEQISFFPLTNSWWAIKNRRVLDLSYCQNIRSCGLASSTLIINWLFKNPENRQPTKEANNQPQYGIYSRPAAEQLSLFTLERNEWLSEFDPITEEKQNLITKVYTNQNKKIMKALSVLGFFDSIEEFLSDKMKNEYINSKKIRLISSRSDISYPIFTLKYDNYDKQKRDMVDDFFDYAFPIFDEFFKKNPAKGDQLSHILEEIVKNIADHAHADGVIGIDTSVYHGQRKLSILIGDAGPGIYRHMRRALLKDKGNRTGKAGLAEVYRHALCNDVSSLGGTDNYGCGMSSIVNSSIALGAQLSVFDVTSRLVLSSLSPIAALGPSHNEIWRISFRFDGHKPFFYFIQCED